MSHYTFNSLNDLRPADTRDSLGQVTSRPLSEVPYTPVDLTLVPEPSNWRDAEKWRQRALDTWELLTRERDERCAYFIEEVWARCAGDREHLIQQVATEARVKGRVLDNSELMNRSAHAFHHTVDVWQAQREAKLASTNPDDWDDMDRSYSRLWEIAAFGTHYQITNDGSVAGFFRRGFENGAWDMWDLIDVAPRTFTEQLGRHPSPDEKRQLLETIPRISTALASANIALEKALFDLLRHINMYTRDDPARDVRIRPSHMKVSLRPMSGLARNSQVLGWHLTVRHEALQELAERLNGPMAQEYAPWVPQVTVGCPAIGARGSGEYSTSFQSVLSEYEEWCIRLAQAAVPQYTSIRTPETVLVGT